MMPNVCRSSAELRPNSHMLPSRTEPNIRPNSSAELRRLPNFGPSLLATSRVQHGRLHNCYCYTTSSFCLCIDVQQNWQTHAHWQTLSYTLPASPAEWLALISHQTQCNATQLSEQFSWQSPTSLCLISDSHSTLQRVYAPWFFLRPGAI